MTNQTKISAQINTVVFDLDGVIYKGDSLQPGAYDLLIRLKNRGIVHHFFTNTSFMSTIDLQNKLKHLGIDVEVSKITHASEIAVAHLHSIYGIDMPILTVGGGNGISSELNKLNMQQISIEDIQDIIALRKSLLSPCPLLIGWTQDFNYKTATTILQLESVISEVYATNNDRLFSSESENFPGTSWINGAIQNILLKEPLGLGKPNPQSLNFVLNKINANPETTLIVGDSLISDIKVGKATGCVTALVLGGSTSYAELTNTELSPQPDFVVKELEEIGEILFEKSF